MALTTIIPNTTTPFVKPQSVSHISNGISTDINGVQFPLQVGVPVQNIYTFKIIPAPSSDDCVAAAQSLGQSVSGGSLTLQSSVQGTAPNIISQPVIFLGQKGVLLDCERALGFSFSIPTTQDTVCTVTGYDYRGVAIKTTSEDIPAGTSGTTVTTPICIVTDVSFSTNPIPNSAGTISVGNTTYIGLPYLLTNAGFIVSAIWAGEVLDPDEIILGYDWRTLAELDTGSTARGFLNLFEGGGTDGTNMLVFTYYVYGSDSELNAEINNHNQSSLKIVGVQKTASSSYATPTYVLPYLVEQDLVGVQINQMGLTNPGGGGDEAFMVKYADACLV